VAQDLSTFHSPAVDRMIECYDVVLHSHSPQYISGYYINLQLTVIKSTYLKCVHVPHYLMHYSATEGNMQEQHKQYFNRYNTSWLSQYQMLVNLEIFLKTVCCDSFTLGRVFKDEVFFTHLPYSYVVCLTMLSVFRCIQCRGFDYNMVVTLKIFMV
jgi:hypothetical protein